MCPANQIVLHRLQKDAYVSGRSLLLPEISIKKRPLFCLFHGEYVWAGIPWSGRARDLNITLDSIVRNLFDARLSGCRCLP